MTGPAFRANLKEPFRQLKVLPNYRFLSLASIFFVLLLCFLENFPFLLLLLPFCLFLQVSFCPSNGSHMSTKWPRDCCDKTLFFFLFLSCCRVWIMMFCLRYTKSQLGAGTPVQTTWPWNFLIHQSPRSIFCDCLLLSSRKLFASFFSLMHVSLASRDINSSYIFKSL